MIALTGWELIVVLRRQWLAGLAVLLITACSMLTVMRLPGVYQAQIDVLFLAPQHGTEVNSLQTVTGSLIATAGMIGRSVSGTASGGLAPVSDGVTLIGQGVRDGTSIRLPNVGGQWAYNFNRPVLDVQAAGSSADQVLGRVEAMVERINAELLRRQQAAGVDPDKMIRTQLSPSTPSVFYEKGDRHRAAGATGLLGFGLGLAAIIVLDRRRHRLPSLDR